MEEDENSWGLEDAVAPHFGLIFCKYRTVPQAK